MWISGGDYNVEIISDRETSQQIFSRPPANHVIINA